MLAGLMVAAQSPPVVSISTPAVPIMRAEPQIATWRYEAARCGDADQPIVARAPSPAPFLEFIPQTARPSVGYAFSIAADGRPLDIKRLGGWVEHGEDLAPALAAARFAAGARRGCTITFTVAQEPLATAPIEHVLALAAHTIGTQPRPILDRIKATGDCFTPPVPAIRERVFPDLKALPQVPGAPGWTATRFDLDANGRPVRVETAAGSGNPALDRAAVEAWKRSRFEPGARRGCLWPTGLRGATLAAPPAPQEAAMRPAGATCPEHLPFVRQPTLTMPEPYRRRGIEGWAVVAYDVAPWGAIGNIRVLAAEPTAEFGDWALRVIGNATKSEATTGYVGCVDRVLFKLGDEAKLVVSAPPALPPPID